MSAASKRVLRNSRRRTSSALAQVSKLRMREHRGVHRCRIDTDDLEPALQQRLAASAGRTTEFDRLLSRRYGKLRPLECFGHFQISARHHSGRRPHVVKAPFVRRGARLRAMRSDPPLSGVDQNAVEDLIAWPGFGRRGSHCSELRRRVASRTARAATAASVEPGSKS